MYASRIPKILHYTLPGVTYESCGCSTDSICSILLGISLPRPWWSHPPSSPVPTDICCELSHPVSATGKDGAHMNCILDTKFVLRPTDSEATREQKYSQRGARKAGLITLTDQVKILLKSTAGHPAIHCNTQRDQIKIVNHSNPESLGYFNHNIPKAS